MFVSAEVVGVNGKRMSSDCLFVYLSTGQSHLIDPRKNAQKILVVPASFETLGMDAHPR